MEYVSYVKQNLESAADVHSWVIEQERHTIQAIPEIILIINQYATFLKVLPHQVQSLRGVL